LPERVIRAAVVQDAPVLFDSRRTLDKVADLTARAARRGATLVLFPEAFVSAYPHGLTFGAVFGARTAEGHEEFRRYWESAIDVPGVEVARLSKIARENGVHLVIGVIERAVGTLYCTVLFLSPEDGLLGKHRKLMPTGSERLVWGQGDGSTMPVFETAVGRLGAVICWENYMPLLRAAMYAKGVEVYCAPTADDLEIWTATVRHIAKEGRCFVLSACQFLRRSDCPADYGSAIETDGTLIRGGSVIAAPSGEVLAGPLFDRRDLLVADLDLNDIVRGKFDLDVSGHSARPDVFRLEVDESSRAAVAVSNCS
jgi:nitrilase